MTSETSPGKLLAWTSARQAIASDPANSVWVAANAGSGKTHVLSQRVIRLLLDGARPSSILCLTYTKAAASEMSNRVFDRLAKWTQLSDRELGKALYDMEGRAPDAARLVVARQLFALALETPGGLKIQTIHAFAEALLHQFPLEANVAGHFSVLDDGETATLLAEAKRTLLSATTTEDDVGLADAFAEVLEAAGEQGLETLLNDLVGKRQELARFVEDARMRGGYVAVLARALDISPDEDADAILAALWPLPALPPDLIAVFHSAACAQKNATPKKFAEALLSATHVDDPQARWRMLAELFMTKSGDARSLRHAVSDGVLDLMPDARDRLEATSAHLMQVADRLRTVAMFRATCAALVLGNRLIADYERLKRQRGRLDFDDLIARTADLLQRGGAGAWVHYKLDQGIDHVLIDEAQDTSPAQWAIVRGLTDEFFAGEGAASSRRTLFSVGDEKQSIYSFQGARPERFREEGRDVRGRAEAAMARFEDIALSLSFRSTRDVLGAVDLVFRNRDSKRGLGPPDTEIIHETVRGSEPGLVDLWDMIGKEKASDDDDWTAPFDDTPESDPRTRLAKQIAATIRDWIDGEHRVEKGRRVPIRAGDILVLVRKRDGFVNALMRELKQSPAVPVAGADRLKLTDHIAVKDLMALGRFILMPDDDLSLAALLKSPLFYFDEDAIFELCHERPEEMGVAASMRHRAARGHAMSENAVEVLDRYEALARRMSPHDFYAHVLGPEGGRAAFLARLGSEAADVLDEFLAFALDHEASGLPGLGSFLAVLDQISPEIKRELEQGRDEVRIMTVHASKGLEAPIVFLVDSGGQASRAQHIAKLRTLDLARSHGPMAPALLWVPSKAHENAVSERLKAELMMAAEEEYRRLLYVGMTRAADRLVVCGYHGINPPPGPHWLGMVRSGLEEAGAAVHGFSARAQRWEGLRFVAEPGRLDGIPDFPPGEAAEGLSQEPPRWRELLSPLPPPSRPPRPLVPSGASAVIDDEAAQPSAGSPLLAAGAVAQAGGSLALQRGRIVHRFLQVLPELPTAEREAAARRYLERAWPTVDQAAADEIVGSVMTILSDPAFASVFAPQSEAEVAVMGTVSIGGRDHVISGRLDRIAVLDDRVLVVDYKTNRPPRTGLGDVPFSHLGQMALYRRLIEPLYPGRRIETALLYTEGPALLVLPEDALAAALAEIAAK
jgi:ATP-dependent helicase/nuclease subunit A